MASTHTDWINRLRLRVEGDTRMVESAQRDIELGLDAHEELARWKKRLAKSQMLLMRNLERAP